MYEIKIGANLPQPTKMKKVQSLFNYQYVSSVSWHLFVCLNFTLALQVGEVVALKISDFSETLVHIQRTEIKHYDKLDNGKIIRNGI